MNHDVTLELMRKEVLMAIPQPPSPKHLIRAHSDQISALCFSDDNERLYSGDTSGLVVVTSTRSLRSLVSWKTHSAGLLGLKEWQARFIITHGRDNKLHVWKRVVESSTTFFGSATLPLPELLYSLDVNAMNFCSFSLLDDDLDGSSDALVAVPNLVESSLADVWSLPSRQRIHAAIGKTSSSSVDKGIIMSLHLYKPSTLQLLAAYENGSVGLYRFDRTDGKQTSVEGVGWQALWNVKLHAESVMAMAVSRDLSLALTVSADHLIGRYDLLTSTEKADQACTIHRTKHPGNAAITFHDDGKVCAVGGWDGRIRLYSTKSLKPLGTLEYHKSGCHAVAFARSSPAEIQRDVVDLDENEETNEMDEEEKEERSRWLAGGGKDGRVSIWPLISFHKK